MSPAVFEHFKKTAKPNALSPKRGKIKGRIPVTREMM
jgi:hypothetical protein